MHRVFFKIGNFEIYTYGVMLVIGYLTAICFTMWRNKNKNIINEDIMDFSFYLLLSGIIGARVFYVMLHLKDYISSPISMLNLREGGLAWHGALVGGFIAFAVFSKKRGIDVYAFLDLCAPSIMLGLAIGRIGCFLNGCCVGNETTLPWGIVFKSAGYFTPRHPTQLYELFFDLVIFAILLWWDKRKKFEGETVILMFVLYSAVRFIVECFRLSPPRYFGLSIAQYSSIFIAIIALAWLFLGRKKMSAHIFSKKQ